MIEKSVTSRGARFGSGLLDLKPNQDDLLRFREVDVGEIAQDVSVVNGRAALGDLDMAPTFERREQHEEIGRAVALVLVVVTRGLSCSHGLGRARLRDELLARLIEADQRARRIVRPRVDVEHVLHRRDERCVGFRWDHPVVGQVRLEVVFLSARPTVLKCAAGTILRSTTCSANRRMLQRAWPAGGSEQAL